MRRSTRHRSELRLVDGKQVVIGQGIYAPYDGVYYSAKIASFPANPGTLKTSLDHQVTKESNVIKVLS